MLVLDLFQRLMSTKVHTETCEDCKNPDHETVKSVQITSATQERIYSDRIHVKALLPLLLLTEIQPQLW